jgi:hypothetical protein
MRTRSLPPPRHEGSNKPLGRSVARNWPGAWPWWIISRWCRDDDSRVSVQVRASGARVRGNAPCGLRVLVARLVVVRDDLGLTGSAKALLDALEGLGAARERASMWPGTDLLGEQADVWRISATASVVRVLLEASDRLYGWRQPGLPEDLAFLRRGGSVVLGTIAHEEDGWLDLSPAEHAELLASCGALVDLVPR